LAALCGLVTANAAEITRDGNAVFLSGPIEAKDLKTFHDAVGNDEKLTVYLSSPGGEVHPATMIGVLIRDRKLATMVPAGATCASACALIWMAGLPRKLGTRSRLGLHCYRLGLTATECYEPGRAEQELYLKDMGAPPPVAAIPQEVGLPMVWLSPQKDLVITEKDIREIREAVCAFAMAGGWVDVKGECAPR